jgi:hypothetical protein
MTNDNNEQSGEKKRKVAKTMLYRKPKKEQELPPAQPSAEPPVEKPKTKVAKTKLDHRLIMNVQSQFGERKNERLQQEIASRQLEPVKQIEPIQAQKMVTACPFSWTDESVKERFRYCGNCQKAIYQLDGLEIEQAEALILKRENRDKFVLYERPDGKFMTSDCPVAQKRRMQIVGLVAGVCVCVAAAVAAFIMMPPSSQSPSPSFSDSSSDPTASVVTTTPTDAGGTSAKSDGSATSGGTTHHYEAGDPIPATPPSSGMSTKKPEKTFSEQEQKGEFWQFPNGQPADDFSRPQAAPSGN